jgi:hypothetical protein
VAVPIPARPVVVTALPLKRRGRQRLQEQLGDVDVRDIRDVVFEASLVLAPACSPQAIAKLKAAFPTARLVVVELEDWDFGISLPSPVKRLLNAGADAYVLADSIDDLAEQLLPTATRVEEKTQRVVELAQPSVDDMILTNLEAQLRARARVRRAEA